MTSRYIVTIEVEVTDEAIAIAEANERAIMGGVGEVNVTEIEDALTWLFDAGDLIPGIAILESTCEYVGTSVAGE